MSRLARLVAGAVLVLALALPAHAQPFANLLDRPDNTGTVVTPLSTLSEIGWLGRAPDGTPGEWTVARYGGQMGWVETSNFALNHNILPVMGSLSATGDAPLYAGPGPLYAETGRVKSGQRLIVASCTSDAKFCGVWLNDGTHGFIDRRFLPQDAAATRLLTQLRNFPTIDVTPSNGNAMEMLARMLAGDGQGIPAAGATGTQRTAEGTTGAGTGTGTGAGTGEGAGASQGTGAGTGTGAGAGAGAGQGTGAGTGTGAGAGAGTGAPRGKPAGTGAKPADTGTGAKQTPKPSGAGATGGRKVSRAPGDGIRNVLDVFGQRTYLAQAAVDASFYDHIHQKLLYKTTQPAAFNGDLGGNNRKVGFDFRIGGENGGLIGGTWFSSFDGPGALGLADVDPFLNGADAFVEFVRDCFLLFYFGWEYVFYPWGAGTVASPPLMFFAPPEQGADVPAIAGLAAVAPGYETTFAPRSRAGRASITPWAGVRYEQVKLRAGTSEGGVTTRFQKDEEFFAASYGVDLQLYLTNRFFMRLTWARDQMPGFDFGGQAPFNTHSIHIDSSTVDRIVVGAGVALN